jgi:prevent-host-death family protein
MKPMKTTTYTNARRNLAAVMTNAVRSGKPVKIERRGRPSIVIVSLDKYTAMMTALGSRVKPALRRTAKEHPRRI